jgi:hypothetical protein
MTAHHSPCATRQLVGHLVWHEVSFCGPDAACACELPENQQGHLDHVFESLSVYPHTFTTTASTSPAALRVVGPASPEPVTVLAPKKAALRKRSSKGSASQTLEHQTGTGVGLPHTGTVDFTTSVTKGTVALPSPANAPAINVILKP